MNILRRNAEDRFSTVQRHWEGATVVILGCGPSLTLEQIDQVRAALQYVCVIAINDSYLIAEFADVHYAADSKWFSWHNNGVAKPNLGLTGAEVRDRWEQFPGEKCGIQTAEPYHTDGVHVLRASNAAGLSRDPAVLHTGRLDGFQGHSGFQALNLAVLAGAKTIILLGFDGRPSAAGKTNFHGEHPVVTPPVVWEYIRRSFSPIENELKAVGVRVINCSPGTGIDTFPKADLQEALTDLALAA